MDQDVFIYFEDGQTVIGKSLGHQAQEPFISEVVFNTSMQGYQEVFTDPSYCDQSIVMTYPSIGNYGINLEDYESINPVLQSIIIRDYCDKPSNFRSKKTLQDFLVFKKIVGIYNVDTRMLTKKIRNEGSMKVLISFEEVSNEEQKSFFKQELATDQIRRVSTKTISHFPNSGGKRIVLIDYGYKKNILQSLIKRDCEVFVVPYDTSFETIEDLSPDGVLLSNGPGDPESISSVLPIIKKVQSKFPLFAICMGHEIFAMANNAKIEKMKFGHRGANHPVKDFENDRVYITSQNHSYCVSHDSIEKSELEVTQVNLNDKTIEGLKHKTLPAFSVQYHPEANPGPSDTNYLFDKFLTMLDRKNHA